MIPMFVACRKFGPQSGDSWSRYIEWSGFHHIDELVSTDSMLCPIVLDSLIDADWDYNIHADNYVYFFHDYEYLKRRINYAPSQHNLLAITARPVQPPNRIRGFTHCGYDILDSFESISVLTNCGGFPESYTERDINRLGLVTELDRANEIADTIREAHHKDPHCCDCDVWGIARYSGTNNS